MILLVHGWGYDPSVWDGVCAQLPDLPVTRIDLGFFGAPSDAGAPLSGETRPLLGVGHSLGFLWLLRHAPGCRALLSVSGFARFTEASGYPGVPLADLAKMRRRFEKDPTATLSAFWSECAAAPAAKARSGDGGALLRGLDWLRDWDARTALAEAPDVHALASRDDRIVPPRLTEAAFAGRSIEWRGEGGHVLPLSEPRFVADAICRLYGSLA